MIEVRSSYLVKMKDRKVHRALKAGARHHLADPELAGAYPANAAWQGFAEYVRLILRVGQIGRLGTSDG